MPFGGLCLYVLHKSRLMDGDRAWQRTSHPIPYPICLTGTMTAAIHTQSRAGSATAVQTGSAARTLTRSVTSCVAGASAIPKATCATAVTASHRSFFCGLHDSGCAGQENSAKYGQSPLSCLLEELTPRLEFLFVFLLFHKNRSKCLLTSLRRQLNNKSGIWRIHKKAWKSVPVTHSTT